MDTDNLARVELHPFGFCVTHLVGSPEGGLPAQRRAFLVAGEDGKPTPLIFHGRPWAELFAAELDRAAAAFAADDPDELDAANEQVQRLGQRHGRAYRTASIAAEPLAV